MSRNIRRLGNNFYGFNLSPKLELFHFIAAAASKIEECKRVRSSSRVSGCSVKTSGDVVSSPHPLTANCCLECGEGRGGRLTPATGCETRHEAWPMSVPWCQKKLSTCSGTIFVDFMLITYCQYSSFSFRSNERTVGGGTSVFANFSTKPFFC